MKHLTINTNLENIPINLKILYPFIKEEDLPILDTKYTLILKYTRKYYINSLAEKLQEE